MTTNRMNKKFLFKDLVCFFFKWNLKFILEKEGISWKFKVSLSWKKNRRETIKVKMIAKANILFYFVF